MDQTSTIHFIAGFIAFVREQTGVSKKEMATRLDITPQNLWNLENGYQNLTCEYLDKIIQQLNYSPEQFWQFMPLYLKECSKQAAKNHKLEIANLKA